MVPVQWEGSPRAKGNIQKLSKFLTPLLQQKYGLVGHPHQEIEVFLTQGAKQPVAKSLRLAEGRRTDGELRAMPGNTRGGIRRFGGHSHRDTGTTERPGKG